MTQHQLESLSKEECWAFVASRQVGRFVYGDRSGPAAVPVNYALVGQKIVFRTARDSGPHRALTGQSAFQVDDLHPEEGKGVSVLLRGEATEVPMDKVSELLSHMNQIPRPLAEGVHNTWVILKASEVTGRRLGEAYLAALT